MHSRIERACAAGFLALICASATTNLAAAETTAPVTRPALAPFVERGEIAGAVVLIASGDRVFEHEAVGYADLNTRRPMKKDALFWIASTSKPFVATAVMMLVDEGRLSLDDPVTKFLPHFRPQVSVSDPAAKTTVTRAPTHPITPRMLLNHSSGMLPGSPAETPTLDALPLSERVASYGKQPLLFEPGTRFSYGNADVNTAAYIVELVSGMPFERFLDTRLFDPLGMSETTFCPTATQLRKLPTAYYLPGADATRLMETPIAFLRYPLSDCANRYPVPAGGLFSTASDLRRFAQLLLNGGTLGRRRYLSAAAVDAMTRNQLAEDARQTVPLSAPPDRMGYGLGWGVSLDGAYFHPGTGMTDIRVDPTHKIATILLMQSTTPKAFVARYEIIKASEDKYASASPDTHANSRGPATSAGPSGFER